MAKTYRVGMACMVHDHAWDEVRHWKAIPNVTIVAAADANEPLREKAKKDAGVERTYDSWAEMIEKEDLDIVQAGPENNAAVGIVEACAKKGIHIVNEKPMAATLAQADRMLEAATAGGIKLMINWPSAWSPAMAEWTRRVKAGDIGVVNYMKFRAAHNGPMEIGASKYFWSWLYDQEKNGGGAYMDYCCYAADFAAYLFGTPTSVMGMRGTFMKDYPVPDDNAIVVMKYPHAFAVAEASWTQVVTKASDRANPVAIGSEGSLAVSGHDLLLTRAKSEPESVPVPELKAPFRNGPEYLVHCIENDLPVEGLCSAKVSRDAQEILEAGMRSADTGQTISLPIKG